MMRKKKRTPEKTLPIPTAVKLDRILKARLEKLSRTKDRSVHWLMKTAIEDYVRHEEVAEQLRQETLKRWAEAERNQVVENDSVIAWLETWGTDHEKERPR